MSEYMVGFQTKARNRHRGLFELFLRLEDHATLLLESFHLEADDSQGILVASYFSRTRDGVRAAVILAERGLSVQSRVVLRAALESQFHLRACLSGEFCKKLVTADLVQRNKMLRKADSLSKMADIPSLNRMLSSEGISQFRKEVSEIESGNIPVVEIAKAADCHDLYLGLYTTLSAAVHSSVYDIERRLVFSKDGHIEALSAGPDIDEVEFILIGAVEVLLSASMAAGAFVDKDYMEYWKQVHNQLRRFGEAALAKSEVER